jgi:hypothetical protein
MPLRWLPNCLMVFLSCFLMNVASMEKKTCTGHLGHFIYCNVHYKAYCGGFSSTHAAVLKCHI